MLMVLFACWWVIVFAANLLVIDFDRVIVRKFQCGWWMFIVYSVAIESESQSFSFRSRSLLYLSNTFLSGLVNWVLNCVMELSNPWMLMLMVRTFESNRGLNTFFNKFMSMADGLKHGDWLPRKPCGVIMVIFLLDWLWVDHLPHFGVIALQLNSVVDW